MTISTSKILALSPDERRSVAIREKMHGWTAKDVVKAWYKSEVSFDLTEQEDAIRTRWDWAKSQFMARKTYADIVESMVAEFAIGAATARRDIADSMLVFGDLDKVPKEAHRARAIDMALAAYKIAEDAKDSDGMSKATKVYYLAAGLDKEDLDKIDLEKLMRERTYVEALDPIVRTMILNLMEQSGGVMDVSKIFEQIYTAKGGAYTDFETLPENG